MKRTPNQFGRYPWFPEHGYSYVHPAYRQEFESIEPHDKVFEKHEESEDWLLLRYQSQQFKVKPELYTPIQPLPFTFGDQVRLRGVAPVFAAPPAEITDIIWDPKTHQPFFQIRQGRKKLNQFYRADELRKV
ncbi:hypothetical protein BH24BAC1_BH24BAC1_07620 [soil metagenome]